MPTDGEFTVEEAMEIARQNADAYRDVPSVSRTLLAYIETLEELIKKRYDKP